MSYPKSPESGTSALTAAPTPSSLPTSRPTVPAQRGADVRRQTTFAPGARVAIGRQRVRVTKDLSRIHGAEAPYRNLVKLDYVDSVPTLPRDAQPAELAELAEQLKVIARRRSAARPSDALLTALLKLAALPAGHPSVQAHGRRCWLLVEDELGWSLALELRGGPAGRIVKPGRTAEGTTLTERIDICDLHAALGVARKLLAAAIAHSEQPDIPAAALPLETLRTALS